MLFAAIITWVEIKNTRHMKTQDILTVVEAKRGYLLPYQRVAGSSPAAPTNFSPLIQIVM